MIILPVPPSQNALFYNNKSDQGRGRRVTKVYTTWRETAGWELKIAIAAKKVKKIEAGWYRTRIEIAVGDSADVDNRAKAINDLLHQIGVTPDDRWLWSCLLTRSHDVLPGTVQVSWFEVRHKDVPDDDD